jgi:hypothetical protein
MHENTEFLSAEKARELKGNQQDGIQAERREF